MSTAVEEKALSKEAQMVIDTISNLTVLELADLVKALEDKFGVVAAAPMVMGMAAPAAGGAARRRIPAVVGDRRIAARLFRLRARSLRGHFRTAPQHLCVGRPVALTAHDLRRDL